MLKITLITMCEEFQNGFGPYNQYFLRGNVNTKNRAPAKN